MQKHPSMCRIMNTFMANVFKTVFMFKKQLLKTQNRQININSQGPSNVLNINNTRADL